MEENKKEVKKEEKKGIKKLSYEELENVAKQISAQAEAIAKENQQLKAAIQQIQLDNVYKELELKFKALEYGDFFSPNFIDVCIHSIEDIMTPAEDKEEESEDKKEEE